MAEGLYGYPGKGSSTDSKCKFATITKKRQITIPKEFYDKLDMSPGKVRCLLENGRIVLEPINNGGFWDFSSEILQELVKEGYQGDDLIKEFEKKKQIIKESLAYMVKEASEEIEKGNYIDAEEVFDEIME